MRMELRIWILVMQPADASSSNIRTDRTLQFPHIPQNSHKFNILTSKTYVIHQFSLILVTENKSRCTGNLNSEFSTKLYPCKTYYGRRPVIEFQNKNMATVSKVRSVEARPVCRGKGKIYIRNSITIVFVLNYPVFLFGDEIICLNVSMSDNRSF